MSDEGGKQVAVRQPNVGEELAKRTSEVMFGASGKDQQGEACGYDYRHQKVSAGGGRTPLICQHAEGPDVRVVAQVLTRSA